MFDNPSLTNSVKRKVITHKMILILMRNIKENDSRKEIRFIGIPTIINTNRKFK